MTGTAWPVACLASLASPAFLTGGARHAILLETVLVKLDHVGPGGDVREC
jgi:hypothetical protein